MRYMHFLKRSSLGIVSVIVLLIGVLALLSCGGEGGPIGGGGGGGGGYAAQFLALLPSGQNGASYVGDAACQNCHNSSTFAEPAGIYNEWHNTIHATRNVACEQCHGPGSKHVAQATPDATTILGAPKSTSPIVCAQCHGPTYDQWFASKHRQLVADPVEENIASPALARSSRCIQCHSGLFRSQTAEKGVNVATLTNQQIIDLGTETINDAPHTASCVTCHNPHRNTGNLTGDGKEAYLRHATFNTDTGPVGPGSSAASFVNYDHICAECHNGRGANPSDAALTSGTARPNMHSSNQFNMLMGFGGVEGGGVVERNTAHATAPGQCTKCHMPAADHTFTTKYDISCSPCHTAADASARVTSVRGQILDDLYSLLLRLQAWSQATFGDPDLWDYTSNIQALDPPKTPPNQSLVPIEVKRVRHNYYFIIRDACYGPHNAPYANHLIRVANDNLNALGVPLSTPSARRTSRPMELQALKESLARWRRVEIQSE